MLWYLQLYKPEVFNMKTDEWYTQRLLSPRQAAGREGKAISLLGDQGRHPGGGIRWFTWTPPRQKAEVPLILHMAYVLPLPGMCVGPLPRSTVQLHSELWAG